MATPTTSGELNFFFEPKTDLGVFQDIWPSKMRKYRCSSRFEPLHKLISENYYMHAYGSAYAVSGDVLDTYIARNHHLLRKTRNEGALLPLVPNLSASFQQAWNRFLGPSNALCFWVACSHCAAPR